MSTPAKVDLNRVVKTYVKIREARSAAKHAFEEKDAKLKEQLQTLEGFMLDHMQKTKADSVKTAAGTFFRYEEVTPTGSDWDAFFKWVKKHDAFDALEKRIKKTFIKDYMEEHEGAIPPGVSVYREFVVRVRRGKEEK